jgi:3-methyladenine DNA glycosylase/8-oxoguanine DNA glycosylase
MNDTHAAQLVTYIQSLPDFTLVARSGTYEHMGATITDAMLQSGFQYERQVRPRVERLRITYPQAKTTSAFRDLLAANDPYELLSLNGRKVIWIQEAADFFAARGIETEADLCSWFLADAVNVYLLQELRGIKTKTANYFKLLCGIRDVVAVDTHLRAFLATAGVVASHDQAVAAIIERAADLMGIERAMLDASIWTYQSRQRQQRRSESQLPL